MYAHQELIEQYYQLISVIYYKMKVQHTKYMDINDIIQQCIIHCIQAFESYRPDRKAKLRTFMSLVIKNSILSAMKKSTNEHFRYYALSLDVTIPDAKDITYEERVADRRADYQPREVLYVKETQEVYQGYVAEHCSTLEREVMEYRVIGYSNQDIAKKLHVDIKSIYNAIYRLQKKLENVKYV
jgi:RNA polymerase sigma factor (sigma-70 family)